jgi:hypothetical protein
VDVVNARDRIRVRGSSSELGQLLDFDGVATHVGRLPLWSSSLPDQGHRIVFRAKLSRGKFGRKRCGCKRSDAQV